MNLLALYKNQLNFVVQYFLVKKNQRNWEGYW